ncbi:hypothetical protein ABBQ32_005733 [Trebouxia sp. C0010 RCD-2024]
MLQTEYEQERQARLALIEREKERLGLTQASQALADSLTSAKQPRKQRQPKSKGCDPPRQSARLSSQVRPDYKEDVCAEDRNILSRLTASGFVMASSKTPLPAKPVPEDSSLMSVFQKSSYFAAVTESKLRLVQGTMEEAGNLLTEDGMTELRDYIAHKLGDQLPSSDSIGLTALLKSLVGKGPLSENTLVLNHASANSKLKSSKKRSMAPENSTAYKWVDEKMVKRYRKYFDKGPWCCLIKTDEKFKQVYQGLVKGAQEKAGPTLDVSELRVHIRKKFNNTQIANGNFFKKDGTRAGVRDQPEGAKDDSTSGTGDLVAPLLPAGAAATDGSSTGTSGTSSDDSSVDPDKSS